MSRFTDKNENSIFGVEFSSITIKVRNKIYKIQIWDTAGQERYRSITRAYFKGSACAILVYNINDRKSFENITNRWINDYLDSVNNKAISMVLVGNKFDLKGKREVTYEEGKLLANKYGIQFYEISCQTGENINEILLNSVNEIATKIEKGIYELNSKSCDKSENEIIIDMNKEEKKKSGCIIL
jgi:Ras-related protein Rab-2A